MKQLLAILSVFTVIHTHAQWTSNLNGNTPVCTYKGKQGDPRIVDDKNGGCYVAWKDWRNNNIPDIFVQKFDQFGYPVWMKDGLNLCVNSGDQSTPNLCLDQNGGVIVSWSDIRTIERDIYAQRVDKNGNILWTYDGTVVSNKIIREHNQKIASDGANGAFIAWEEEEQPGLWDLSIQHLDSNGNRLFGPGGMKLTSNNAKKINVRLQSDNKGGVFITWQQENPISDYEIFAQRMDYNGGKLWGANGKQLTNMINAQTNPKIDPDPSINGCYVTWIDKRGGIDYDIYAQRLDSNGITQWGVNGKPVINAVTNQSAQDIISNNRINGLVVVWKDKRNGDDDIFIQKLDKQGNKLWGPNGKPVCVKLFDQLNPSITGDQANGVLVTWQDNSLFGNYNILGQRIDSAGNILWTPNGVVVSNASGNQTGPKNVPDDENGMLVVWEDDRIVTDRNIYMQKISSNGTLTPSSMETQNASVSLYPNPFIDRIVIDQQVSHISLSDIQGNLVPIDMQVANGKTVLNINQDLNTGVYILRGAYESGEQFAVKVYRRAE